MPSVDDILRDFAQPKGSPSVDDILRDFGGGEPEKSVLPPTPANLQQPSGMMGMMPVERGQFQEPPEFPSVGQQLQGYVQDAKAGLGALRAGLPQMDDPLIQHFKQVGEETLQPVGKMPFGAEAIPNVAMGAGRLLTDLPEFGAGIIQQPVETIKGLGEALVTHGQLISRMLKELPYGGGEAWDEFSQNPVAPVVTFLMAKGILKTGVKAGTRGVEMVKDLRPEKIAEVEAIVEQGRLLNAGKEPAGLLQEGIRADTYRRGVNPESPQAIRMPGEVPQRLLPEQATGVPPFFETDQPLPFVTKGKNKGAVRYTRPGQIGLSQDPFVVSKQQPQGTPPVNMPFTRDVGIARPKVKPEPSATFPEAVKEAEPEAGAKEAVKGEVKEALGTLDVSPENVATHATGTLEALNEGTLRAGKQEWQGVQETGISFEEGGGVFQGNFVSDIVLKFDKRKIPKTKKGTDPNEIVVDQNKYEISKANGLLEIDLFTSVTSDHVRIGGLEQGDLRVGKALKSGDKKLVSEASTLATRDIMEKMATKERPKLEKEAQKFADKYDIPVNVIDRPELGGKSTTFTPDFAKQPLASDAGYLQLPDIQDLKKFAGSINLRRLDLNETAEQVLTGMFKKGERKVISWEETRKEADALGLNVKDIKRLYDENKGLTREEMYASREMMQGYMNALGKYVEELPTDPNKFTPDMVADLSVVLMNIKRGVADPISKTASEYGRQLNSLKMMPSKERFMERVLKKSDGTDFTPEQAAELVDVLRRYDMNDPASVASASRFVKSMDKPNFWDYVNEYWYNSILSGVPTHLVNSISNTTWGAYLNTLQRTLKTVAEVPVSILQGRPREYHFREIVPSMIGSSMGIKQGLPKALEMLQKGYTEGDLTKWQLEIQSIGSFERSPHKILRKAAPAITMPTRALRAEDLFFRAIAFEGEMWALSTRMAIKEGAKGKELARRAAEIRVDPPPALIEGASAFADKATYMDAPGVISRQIMKFRDLKPIKNSNFKPFVYVVPFVRTIGNLMKRGLEMTPGVGVAVSRMEAPLKGTKVSEVVANQVTGSAIAYYFAQKYADGELTGSPPRNKAEREAFYEAGKRPYAIKYGNKWVDYRRVEPFGTPIASVAIIGDTYRDYGTEPPLKQVEYAGLEFGRYMLNASYLQGMSSLIKGIESGVSGEKLISGQAERTVGGLAPYSSFQRSLTRGVEAARTGEATLREPKGLKESVLSQFPFTAEDIKARLNVWGDPIKLEGGAMRQFLPYKYSTETDDPLLIELQRLKYYPGMMTQGELSDEDYRELVISAGQEGKKRLTEAISDSRYKAIPRTPEGDEIRLKVLRKRMATVRKKARNKIGVNK